MKETQRERRGHIFLPEDLLLDQLPDLYVTDGIPFAEKLIHLKYFCGAATWLIAELDRDSLLAFGWANLGDPQMAEWGYVDLHELEELRVSTHFAFDLIVERDLHWEPKPFGEF